MFRNIKKHETYKDIAIVNEERLKCELKRYGLREIKDFSKHLLNKEDMAKIKEVRSDKNLIIRKADKSNTIVFMKKVDYERKINDILADENKFIKIAKDPTPQIKKRLRGLIDLINKGNHSIKLPLPVGEYNPGYIYGNPKIHKNIKDPPLRPIISQIGTVTYEIGRRLKDIITPYMPQKYMIQSTHEFINITKTLSGAGHLASLDVENLFTNVPVNDTLDIIMNCMYQNPGVAPPDIPQDIMKQLLKICTEDVPFRNLSGDIYQQKDGVSMGGPLSPVFANFYMAHLENKIIPSIQKPPIVYTRYVDDIFLMIRNVSTLEEIKHKFEKASVLKFTFEIEEKKCISFLDVNVKRKEGSLQTSVYTKPTSTGECINFNSIAPDRYKTGVIKTMLHRAFTISSTYDLLHQEIERLKQVFVNNNFPMDIIESQINKFLTMKLQKEDNVSKFEDIKLYFKNQMSSKYKQQEESLRDIIDKNIKSLDENRQVKLNIYYKNRTLKNLLIINNTYKLPFEQRSHLVYQYQCKREGCLSSIYVGYTECSLVLRMRNHTQNGSIRKHNIDAHAHKVTTNDILKDIKILRHFNNKEDLVIAEALYIKSVNPVLNGQREGEERILAIF